MNNYTIITCYGFIWKQANNFARVVVRTLKVVFFVTVEAEHAIVVVVRAAIPIISVRPIA